MVCTLLVKLSRALLMKTASMSFFWSFWASPDDNHGIIDANDVASMDDVFGDSASGFSRSRVSTATALQRERPRRMADLFREIMLSHPKLLPDGSDYSTAICGAGGESVKQQLGPRGSSHDIRLNIQRPILADQTNVATSGSFVINPQIAQHGAVWSDSKHQVIGAVEVHASASPTETVTVQPDGTIQHAHGDPQCAPLPVLTADDLAGLDDLSSWSSSLLDHIDFTPAQWIDSPATSVGATTSAEPVQHHQPADPASGSLHAIQDPSHDPPCIVSPSAHEVAVPLLPAGPAITVDEHLVGVRCVNWCKEFADKLALVTAAVDVNSLTIVRQSKLGVLAGKRGDRRYQDLEEQTKQAFIAIRAEIARDRMTAESPNTETGNGLAIEALQRKHLDAEAAVRVNTQGIERINTQEGLRAAKTARKFWLMESASEANVNAYRAMSTEMSVMNDTLATLTMNAII
ncbi:uncharacterized protein LOC130404243 [Gadus chalcogrammus]|uniref:uncharacterized protein LOC130404243 n=1 Tax=Gadus chalcogrammus TaxID=1042646 RepID=UPI0024C4A181|nr:uncharacterized protein LOC130404243 [Gadus chalcogrammus]